MAFKHGTLPLAPPPPPYRLLVLKLLISRDLGNLHGLIWVKYGSK